MSRRLRPAPDREVFLTGAASGIGRATAELVASHGSRVHLTDRNGPQLDEVAAGIRRSGGRVGLVETADIADHDAMHALATRLTAEYGAMDVVMNIAGIAAWGTVSAMPHETWRRLVEINLMGPIHVIEELVPPMIDARRGGHLVNVSSAAGIIGMPWHAGYSASKFGLRGVSEVLRFDLARDHIGVSLVCPGGVDTGLTETVEIAGVDNASPRFRKARERFRSHAVSPEQAAASIVRGLERNRYWVYTSPDIRMAHLAQRYFPPGYSAAMHVLNRAANRALPDVQRARRPEVQG
ncbi:SDR family oxidoreductase [Nocardioides terrisoli]|uniref:SDR family oxidoreductase n=1 Tax=Nocardioides terrisoli TaxID=3388267 RepID=UPI00287B60AD|nr:SDR family oxidoreductase [Nocardioides marmorisolisilvae]